jgi:hypothetical protein
MEKTLIEKHDLPYFGELTIWKNNEGDYLAYNRIYLEGTMPFTKNNDLKILKQEIDTEFKERIKINILQTTADLYRLESIKHINWLEKITTQTPEVNSQGEENK